MFNTTLLLLLAFPVIFGIIVWIMRREYAQSWIFSGMYAVIAIVIVLVCFFVSKGSKTSDTEIWNGQVVSKERVHGEYQRSYQCNCVTSTDSKGNSSTTCQTCYEDRYTVHWNCNTTVGEFTIDSLDRGSRRVYDEPDPSRFTSIEKGDPAARAAKYTNYIQAVPNSLFTPAAADLKVKFKKIIPNYPDQVYDYYNVNHFLHPGVPVLDASKWNKELALGLRDLGPKKQVNAIIVIANTNDSNYEYALRDAWKGANKNDVVLVIGSTQYPKIDFVRVISWTKNETFKVELRDAVMAKGTVDRSIIPLMMAQIDKNFKRREMTEFEYLDGEIDPPDWMIYTLMFLVFAGGAAIFAYIPQLCSNGRYR